MIIKDKLIKEYPLLKKINCSLECFEIDKRKYLIFWHEIIKKENIIKILKYLEEKSNNLNFTSIRTLIVIGNTKEKFKKNELVYFNSINMYVIFYLINDETNDIYMDISWNFPLKYSYKKYVKKINKIITNK